MTNNFKHLSDIEFEEIRKVFYSQAYEIVDDLRDSVLGLETYPEDAEMLKAVKRYLHTLKGDSNSLELTSVGTLCHRVEDLLSFLMDGSRHAEPQSVDLLLNCIDTLNRLLLESESGTDGTDIKEDMERIDVFLKKGAEHSGTIGESALHFFTPPLAPPTKGGWGFTEYQELQIHDALKKGMNIYEIEIMFHPMCAEKSIAALMVTQRMNGIGHIISSLPDIEGSDIDTADKMTLLLSTKRTSDDIKKEAFITGISEMIHIKDYPTQDSRVKTQEAGLQTQPSEPLQPPFDSPLNKGGGRGVRSEILRIEASRVDNLMNLVGELIIGRSMVEQMAKDIEGGIPTTDMSARLFAANSYMERTVSDLRKGVMKMRMVPINHVFRKFPKIVRDLSVEKGKLLRLDIFGRETELDKGIVDALGEPLSHIIRNSIDHGIEESAYRGAAGKPEEGLITLRAYHEAAHIVIEVSDDGRGIDSESLKKKAVEKSFLNEDGVKGISERDAINLIFLSGLSTSETVSETSGRGVGMDAVKAAVEAMKGSIEVESEQGKGTMFRLRLPLTLAVIKALLFEVGGRLYAIPLSAVSEITRIMRDDLITVSGKDTLLLRDEVISIIHLEELFRINEHKTQKKFVIILGIGGREIGLLSDRLIGQQDLVIKAVDDHYARSGLVTGASILGDGRVVLILDAPAIFKKAVEEEKKRMVGI